jgi:hypothetical protein
MQGTSGQVAGKEDIPGRISAMYGGKIMTYLYGTGFNSRIEEWWQRPLLLTLSRGCQVGVAFQPRRPRLESRSHKLPRESRGQFMFDDKSLPAGRYVQGITQV